MRREESAGAGAKGTFKRAFREEWLPMALSVGLTKEELGHMTPADIEPYIKKYEIRQKSRLEEINFQSWMTGLYFTHALACAFSQDGSYPQAPFELFQDEIAPEEMSRRNAELFSAYVCEYNSRIKKEEK